VREMRRQLQHNRYGSTVREMDVTGERRRGGGPSTHLLTLYPTSGAFSKNAIHCPESRKHRVRNAWAIISGRTNWMVSESSTQERVMEGAMKEYQKKTTGDEDTDPRNCSTL